MNTTTMTAAAVIEEQQRIIEKVVLDAGKPIQPAKVRKIMHANDIKVPVTIGHRQHEMRAISKIMVYATLEKLADIGRLHCRIDPRTKFRFYSDGGVL